MSPSASSVLDDVRALVAELSGHEPSSISPTLRLRDDLGLDSLQSMELLSRLTEQHGVEPRMEEVRSVVTVGDAAALVTRLMAA